MWLNKVAPLTYHPCGPVDLVIAFGSIYLVILSLVAPPTPPWRLVRVGLIVPLATAGFYYFGFYSLQKDYEDQWGTLVITAYSIIHTWEMLVFFPAEEYSYRVLPRRPARPAISVQKTNGAAITNGTVSEWVVEPVPRPWTWEKFWWASSLFWGMRGIGWNFTPPLPSSSLEPPYTPGSSRALFVYKRLRYYAVGWILQDLVRAYMNLGPGAAFFGGHPGAPAYTDLTQWQRAVYSTCIVIRTVLIMDRTHVMFGVLFVMLGGIMGWDTETCGPWGWSPLFGGLRGIWEKPGLSQMWSRTWHHYFRVWLWKFGWVGLGEKILGLPPSGPSLKGLPSSMTRNDSNATPSRTPSSSGRVSPSHPLPTVPNHKSTSVKMNNLIKSLCVFALTGAIHDYACYFTLYHTRPSLDFTWRDGLVTTPFFVAQPFALALEAAVKSRWRGWKAKSHPEWKGEEPSWLVFVERPIGFVWTWTWLGWSARWFISGVTKTGVYRRDLDQTKFPSLFGTLIWGIPKH